jgi:hypothetical protein
MQVSEQFKNVNLMYLQIATSALYSLADPSTPEETKVATKNQLPAIFLTGILSLYTSRLRMAEFFHLH